MSLLSLSNQGMMMVQHQANLCLSSIQMILLEGPSCYHPGDNRERLRAKVTRKVVEAIEKADGERVQTKPQLYSCHWQWEIGGDHLL